MNLITFVLNYLMALAYMWIPEEWMFYYTIAIALYLYTYYIKVKVVNVYKDIHPFIIGFLSVWLIEILPIGSQEGLSYTLVILIYAYALFKEKMYEENKVKNEKELVKSVIYVVFIPFTAFLTALYIFQDKQFAFVVCYAALFFGVYQSRGWIKHWVFTGCMLLNVTLLLCYTYEYMTVTIWEKVGYIVLFIVAILYAKTKEEKIVSRG